MEPEQYDPDEFAEIAALLKEGFAAQPEPTLDKQRLATVFEPPAKSATPPWRLLTLSAAALLALGLAAFMWHRPAPDLRTPQPIVQGEPERDAALNDVLAELDRQKQELLPILAEVEADPTLEQESVSPEKQKSVGASVDRMTLGLANSNLTTTEGDFSGELTLENAAPSEGLQYATIGQPAAPKQKGGLNGFGIRRDAVTIPLAKGEAKVFAMEVADTTRVSGWDVVLADKLKLSDTAPEAVYDARTLEELIVLQEQSISAEDRRGKYAHGEPSARAKGAPNTHSSLGDRVQDDNNTLLMNNASIFESKLVPAETLVTEGLFRRDSPPIAADVNSHNRVDDRVQDDVNTVPINEASIFASKLAPTETLFGQYSANAQDANDSQSNAEKLRMELPPPDVPLQDYGTHKVMPPVSSLTLAKVEEEIPPGLFLYANASHVVQESNYRLPAVVRKEDPLKILSYRVPTERTAFALDAGSGELDIDGVIDLPEPTRYDGELESLQLEGLDDLEGLGIELDEGNGAPATQGIPVAASADAEGPAMTADDIMADQVVKRKKLQLESEELSIEGRELYLKGKFEDAASKLIAAQLTLDAVSRTDPVMVERKAKQELLLAKLYEEWGDAEVREAKRLADGEQFEDAIDRYRKAMNKNPQRTAEINKKIKSLNRERRFAEFRQQTAPLNVDPEKPRRDYEVDVLMKQGEVFLNHRRYSDARERFEQVLLRDPYNLAATRSLRLLNERLEITGRERREVMNAERIAEVTWKWNDPIKPLVAPDSIVQTRPASPVNPFVMTDKDAQSTFGLESESASYSIARRYISQGYLPPRNTVRMEEFINAFDYRYEEAPGRTFTVHAKATKAPFGKDLTLLKIGIRGKTLGRDGRKPAHLVFVVDSSGSMAREDRLPLVRHALELLVEQLGPDDRVSLVSFCDRSRLLLEAQSATNKGKILEAIARIECSAPTNLLSGIQTGYELATRYFKDDQVNRVILCSDGVANVGPDEASGIEALTRSQREQGIVFTSVGVGEGAYNDNLLEQLANRGDGNYVYLDSRATARHVFVDEFAATMHTIARDAKIQVAFNPERVRRYRLIGYENRDIADREFRNDTVDAGEIGSGQSATALYELELLPGEGDLGTVLVRHRDIESSEVDEFSTRLQGNLVRELSPSDSPRFFLAACAAEFAETLRGSEYSKVDLRAVEQMLIAVAGQLPMERHVEELLETVRAAMGLPRFGE